MNAKGRRQVVRIGSVLILLFAVAPNALYMGHWPLLEPAEPAAASEPTHHHHGAADPAQVAGEAHERAGHCYAGPSKCSEAPATTLFQPAVIEGITLALLAGGLLTLLSSYGQSTVATFVRRIDQPPRRTLFLPTA